MSMSDPIADMLTRIRNASMLGQKNIDMPMSNLKKGIAEILKNEGYIKEHLVEHQKGMQLLCIELKYDLEKNNAITGLKRISKPGRRIYVSNKKIPKVMSGLGISILSTSKGIIADHDARKNGLGGELLCEIW